MNFKHLDIDYLDKLSPKQRKWLYKFLIEYYFGVKTKESFHDERHWKEIEKKRNAFRRDMWNNMKRVTANENHEKEELKSNGPKKRSRST